MMTAGSPGWVGYLRGGGHVGGARNMGGVVNMATRCSHVSLEKARAQPCFRRKNALQNLSMQRGYDLLLMAQSDSQVHQVQVWQLPVQALGLHVKADHPVRTKLQVDRRLDSAAMRR